jgi:hypothetical protein
MVEEDKFKELVSSTIGGLAEVARDTNVAVLGAVEFELSVVTKKGAGGSLKLVLVEAGAGYQKEEISRVKFYMGPREGAVFQQLGWKFK